MDRRTRSSKRSIPCARMSRVTFAASTCSSVGRQTSFCKPLIDRGRSAPARSASGGSRSSRHRSCRASRRATDDRRRSRSDIPRRRAPGSPRARHRPRAPRRAAMPRPPPRSDTLTCSWSTADATRYANARDDSSATYMSASLPCISSKDPIGTPNWRRSRTYGNTKSSAACMIPIGPPQSTSRSVFRPDISTRTPSPGWPSTWSSGIRQSSKSSSHVPEPRIPSLSRCWAALNPGMPRSITKAVIGEWPPASSVRM